MFLELPERPPKPRDRGVTIVLDSGLPTVQFSDVVQSHGDLIDIVKFGWGTALVTRDLERKADVLREHGIGYFLGGTLFEKALSQDRVPEFLDFCRRLGCTHAEISNGTFEVGRLDKSRYIAEFAERFKVFSEVGFKDEEKSLNFAPVKWAEDIRADLAAGASKVVLEARESGTSGICRPNGEVRYGLIRELIESGIDLEHIVFEAPNKMLQTYFIKEAGANVNLANISPENVVGLETLRLGLRFDTFFLN